MSSRSPPSTPPLTNHGPITFPSSILPTTPKTNEKDSSAYSTEYQKKIAEQREKYETKLAEDTSIFGELMFTKTNPTGNETTTTSSIGKTALNTQSKDLEGLKICSVRSLSDKNVIFNENTNSSNNTNQSSHEDEDDDNIAANNNDNDNDSAGGHINNDEDSSSVDKDCTGVRDLIIPSSTECNKKMFGIAKQKINNKDTVSNRFLRMTQHHRNGGGITTKTTSRGRGVNHRRRGRGGGASKLIISGGDEKKKSKIFNYREQCEKTYRNTFRKDNKEQQPHQKQQQPYATTSQSDNMDINDDDDDDDDDDNDENELSDDDNEDVDVTKIDEEDETINDKNEKLNQLTHVTITHIEEPTDKSEISSKIINKTQKNNNNDEISAIINLDSDSDDLFDINSMEIDTTISSQHENNLPIHSFANTTANYTNIPPTVTSAAITNIPSTSGTSNSPNTTTNNNHNNTNSSSSSSRRKTVHKPLLDHGNVIFEEQRVQKLKESNIQIGLVKSAENPNEDLMKKIAFLRCCVSYMMDEFHRKPIQFQRGMTLNNLKTAYALRKDGKK